MAHSLGIQKERRTTRKPTRTIRPAGARKLKNPAAQAKAKMPIRGLAPGEDDVEFEGVPFEQISKAQQTRVAMAIGMAQNPAIKVIMINDGSLCDSETMQEIQEIAELHDYQVWIERVSDKKRRGEKGSVFYIEDGEVV